MATHLFSLILSLSTLFALVNGVSINIDCGYTGDEYTDDNSLVWNGDIDGIGNSQTMSIPINSVDKPMRALRVFTPNQKKNCYAMDVDKGEKVMLRASFYYGNYDKKSSPPTFELQFDGNHWAKVVTSLDQVVTYEAIYVTKTASASICVAQLFPDQFAFISALQFESLDSDMYSFVSSDQALFLRTRIACGSKDTIRYPQDSYDRIWNSAATGDGLLSISNDGSFVDVSNLADSPPQEVLQNAFTTSNTSTTISLGSIFPSDPTLLYINMYFAELKELDTTESRSFKLLIDNVDSYDPIVPVYGVAEQRYLSNFTAYSKTLFTLEATKDSTLPPLLNALEVFTISGTLSEGTYSADVDGLHELQKQFDSLTQWAGEPCLPVTYTWDWLNCSTDSTPRVTALNLAGFNLSGELPDFSSLTALETIDFHNNSLEGSIPDFLGTLPNLKLLNLADNKFSGPVPSSISKNNKLKLVVSGNSDLCVSGNSCKQVDTNGDGSSTTKKSSNLPIILGTVIPIFVLIWIVIGVFVLCHQKRKSAPVIGQNAQQGGFMHMNNGMGQKMMNEIRVNMNDQTSADSSDQNQQGGNGYDTTNS